jgi:aconitate hydratase
LLDRGVAPADFNTYGCRRGNPGLMARATFANVRLRNRLVEDREGGWTRHHPSGEVVTIYEAAGRYGAAGTPLIVLAGREYGFGSSRDWAAKGPRALGVRAVIARGYERIHRSNLVAAGILPLQFLDGEDADALGLTGEESFDVTGLRRLRRSGFVEVVATGCDGATVGFTARARVDADADAELEYLHHDGIVPLLVRRVLASTEGSTA